MQKMTVATLTKFVSKYKHLAVSASLITSDKGTRVEQWSLQQRTHTLLCTSTSPYPEMSAIHVERLI